MLELPTSKRILKEAQDLIQRRGFFGLSLQDLADRIQIRKPSLYAHYDSKEALAVALLRDYLEGFQSWSGSLSGSPEARIKAFLGIYDEYVVDGKVCPHAALALDGPLLPPSIQEAYRSLREAQVLWLAQVIGEGMANGEFRSDIEVGSLAERLIQQMVGAQLGVRVTGDRVRYEEMKEEICRSLKKFH
jgi:TetR/AcrR family transcriptional repressor of nem operon